MRGAMSGLLAAVLVGLGLCAGCENEPAKKLEPETQHVPPKKEEPIAPSAPYLPLFDHSKKVDAYTPGKANDLGLFASEDDAIADAKRVGVPVESLSLWRLRIGPKTFWTWAEGEDAPFYIGAEVNKFGSPCVMIMHQNTYDQQKPNGKAKE